MIYLTEEQAQQIEEVLVTWFKSFPHQVDCNDNEALATIRAARAQEQAEQEPVACIVRDCCEAEKADPDHSDTICIAVDDLTEIVTHHTTAPVQQAEQEPEVWYCPDCGTLSETQVKCCPDWIRSRKVPKNFALTCKATFDRNVQAEQEPVHESLQIAAVALQDIACSSQTNNLLWWQIRAREAQKQIAERLTNSAPAEPVKQEPVASVRWGRYKECEWTAAERLHELLGRYREGQTPLQLYAAPVRTKDLTDDEIWGAYSTVTVPVSTPKIARAVIAADRKLNGVEK